MRVHGHVRAAEGEQQDAGGGLAANAGQLAELGAGSVERLVGQPREVVVSDGSQDLLDPPGLHARDAARPDGLLHLVLVGVAHFVPAVETLAQARVRHVAIAVVRVLGQDREDQLVHRGVMGTQVGPSVCLAKAVADGAQLATRGGLPLGHGGEVSPLSPACDLMQPWP